MKPSNTPFRSITSSRRNAVIDKSSYVLSKYAGGYFLGAHKLTTLARDDEIEREYLVYPICYLHRHSIELELKELISKGEKVLGASKSNNTHHRIKDLWSYAKLLLTRIDPSALKELDPIETVIEYLADVDPDAQSFRYPSKVDGNCSLLDVAEVDLDSLEEMVYAAILLLWGCAELLDS